MDAKHRSAAHGSGSGDCCPSSVYHKDGLAPRDYGTYKYIREEAYGSYLLPTDDELRDRTLVQLKMFYSSQNNDNFLGTNASYTGSDFEAGSYVEVLAESLDGKTNLSSAVATIFATPPNSSFVPMDLYWSPTRKDIQNVASAAAHHWLAGGDYVKVQRLGWVLSTNATAPKGTGVYGTCRFGLPSTPNNDPAYADHSYWRGRTWGPLNLLVYMGLRHPKYADVPELKAVRKQLAIQSREAMMVEWLPKHHVHENLSPDTGLGDDVGNSNPMYHWGACMVFMELWESGKF